MVFFNIITWVIIDQMHKTANKRRSVDIECLVKLMGVGQILFNSFEVYGAYSFTRLGFKSGFLKSKTVRNE